MDRFNTSGDACPKKANGQILSLSLAIALSVAATSVVAQTTFDFEDPLDQVRAKIELIETGETAAPEGEAGAADVARGDVAAKPDVKDPLARISERFGLPPLGLVALAGLALLALLLGLMWLLGGFRKKHGKKREDGELYAVADGTRGRRELESGSVATRNRKTSLDTRETDDLVAPGTAAASAAAILSGTDENRSDDYQQDEDFHFDEAVDQPTLGENTPVHSDDETASWARPNLDRLKASIREDWQSGKEAEKSAAAQSDAQPEPAGHSVADTAQPKSSLRDESENFASLFGDESENLAAVSQAKETPPVMNKLGQSGTEETFFGAELRDVVKAKADVRPTGTPPLPGAANQPTREDAMRRIRALRESLKAS